MVSSTIYTANMKNILPFLLVIGSVLSFWHKHNAGRVSQDEALHLSAKTFLQAAGLLRSRRENIDIKSVSVIYHVLQTAQLFVARHEQYIYIFFCCTYVEYVVIWLNTECIPKSSSHKLFFIITLFLIVLSTHADGFLNIHWYLHLEI